MRINAVEVKIFTKITHEIAERLMTWLLSTFCIDVYSSLKTKYNNVCQLSDELSVCVNEWMRDQNKKFCAHSTNYSQTLNVTVELSSDISEHCLKSLPLILKINLYESMRTELWLLHSCCDFCMFWHLHLVWPFWATIGSDHTLKPAGKQLKKTVRKHVAWGSDSENIINH